VSRDFFTLPGSPEGNPHLARYRKTSVAEEGAIANIPTEFLVSELPCPFYFSFSMEHLTESGILKEIKQCVAL